ncbi:hypothetical protein [Streptomyces sp. NPDC048419]|uniref:hypothetical protein n=1 Tax=Streptomyces sp. NPDC048419 TaxID=3365547 RepID=UPI003723D219
MCRAARAARNSAAALDVREMLRDQVRSVYAGRLEAVAYGQHGAGYRLARS